MKEKNKNENFNIHLTRLLSHATKGDPRKLPPTKGQFE